MNYNNLCTNIQGTLKGPCTNIPTLMSLQLPYKDQPFDKCLSRLTLTRFPIIKSPSHQSPPLPPEFKDRGYHLFRVIQLKQLLSHWKRIPENIHLTLLSLKRNIKLPSLTHSFDLDLGYHFELLEDSITTMSREHLEKQITEHVNSFYQLSTTPITKEIFDWATLFWKKRCTPTLPMDIFDRFATEFNQMVCCRDPPIVLPTTLIDRSPERTTKSKRKMSSSPDTNVQDGSPHSNQVKANPNKVPNIHNSPDVEPDETPIIDTMTTIPPIPPTTPPHQVTSENSSRKILTPNSPFLPPPEPHLDSPLPSSSNLTPRRTLPTLPLPPSPATGKWIITEGGVHLYVDFTRPDQGDESTPERRVKASGVKKLKNYPKKSLPPPPLFLPSIITLPPNIPPPVTHPDLLGLRL